jgi:hypothetical protein
MALGLTAAFGFNTGLTALAAGCATCAGVLAGAALLGLVSVVEQPTNKKAAQLLMSKRFNIFNL